MSLTTRRPDVSEAAAMAALHVQCWREAYGPIIPAAILDRVDMVQRMASWRANLASDQKYVCAAYEGDEPVGFVLAMPNSDAALPGADGQVAALYVLAHHHRAGTGRRLMAGAARWWLSCAGETLGVNVLANNAPARAFYERLGGRLVRTGTYIWDGYPLPDAAYIFESLHTLAATA